MSGRFQVFEVSLTRRGRGWRWRVLKTNGDPVMDGWEKSRAAAGYQANRALLLLLLSAPYRLGVSGDGPTKATSARKSPLARSL
jgi:hypothetical protein